MARGENCQLNFLCEFLSEITIIYMQENIYCEVLHNNLLGKEGGGDLLLQLLSGLKDSSPSDRPPSACLSAVCHSSICLSSVCLSPI